MNNATKFWIAPHQGLPLQAGEVAEFPRTARQSALVLTVTAFGLVALGAFLALVLVLGAGR